MKKFFFSALIFLILSISATAQCEDCRVVNPYIDVALEKWSYSWMFDSYISRSCVTTNVEESTYFSDEVVAQGYFYVKRVGRVYHSFTAYIRITNGELIVRKICYVDSTTDDSRCKEF